MPEHCPSHNERNEWISSLEETLEEVRDDMTTMKTQRNTALYLAGGFLTLIAVISTLLVFIFRSNLDTITAKLERIDTYITSAGTSDTEIKGRLANIEWRIQQLEARK